MQPNYPPGAQYPAQQYPPAPPAQYPPQPMPPGPQYPAQQYPAQQPQPPAQTGSLDQFYSQPSVGTKAIAYKDKAIGHTFVGRVARKVTNADIRQQTDPTNGRPKFFSDGSPMWVMVVPLEMVAEIPPGANAVQAAPEFPDGQASLWVRGQLRDELARAMAEAGAPEGPPEAGAWIYVTLSGKRQTRMGNPAHQFTVRYIRPEGAATAPQSAQPAPAQVRVPDGNGIEQPVQAPPAPAPAPSAAIGAATPQVQVTGGQPAAPQLSPEQQELYARLTGQQAA